MPRRLTVRSLMLLVLLIVLVLPPVSLPSVFAAACGTALNLGIPLQCSLSTPGAVHQYALTSPAGDIILRAARLNGTMKPSIRLLDAGGTELCKIASYGTVAEIPRCSLPAAGTYTVELSDRQATGTGQYVIHAQHLSAPAATSPLTLGEMTLDSLALGGTLMSYQINGSAGDVWLIRAGSSISSLNPALRLFAPDGSEVCKVFSYGVIGEITTCLLPADGAYLLLFNDYTDAGTGSYSIMAQSLRTPAHAESVPIGTRIPGTITTSGALQTYAFTGSVDDVVVLHVGSDRSSLTPRVDLFDPEGTRVCGASTYGIIASTTPCPLPRDGTYTAVVSDYNDGGTGSYGLTMQRLNAPEQAADLPAGVTTQAAITLPGEVDSYSFAGQSGEAVILRMASVRSSLTPAIRVYSDQGMLVCSHGSYGQIAEVAPCLLPTDGRYVVLVNDYNDAGKESYGLSLQRFLTPANTRTLPFDTPHTANLSAPGELAGYTIKGYANAAIRLRMTDLDNRLNPEIRLYTQDGTFVCGRSTYGDIAETTSCVLPADGDYLLLVNEWNTGTTGRYEVEAVCDQAAACGPEVTVEPEEPEQPDDPDDPEQPEQPGNPDETLTFVYLPAIVRR